MQPRSSDRRGQRGFTLIELVIIIVILGILAAVAIPKYQDITQQAKISSVKGGLGGLRSAISIFYANKAVTTGSPAWPTQTELSTIGTVMEQDIPDNPFQTNKPDSIVAGTTRGTVVGSSGGWAYKASSGEIWPNTNVVGENNY